MEFNLNDLTPASKSLGVRPDGTTAAVNGDLVAAAVRLADGSW